jgi:hypothetical protein
LQKSPASAGFFYGSSLKQVKNPTQSYTFSLHPDIFRAVHINISFISRMAIGRYTRPYEKIW